MITDTVKDGRFVAFAYKVTDSEGNLLFEATEKAPDTIIFGKTEGLVPGLAAAMAGLKAGDKFEVTLPPDAAFGQYDPKEILELPVDIFSADGTLPDSVKVGAVLPMRTAEGYIMHGKVIDIKPDKVTMDFNHPFAGKTVTFKGKIIEVRPATEEELHPRCGGCCGGGGNCGDGDGNCGGGDCSCGGCS